MTRGAKLRRSRAARPCRLRSRRALLSPAVAAGALALAGVLLVALTLALIRAVVPPSGHTVTSSTSSASSVPSLGAGGADPESRGELRGRVLDAEGNPVPGAVVRAMPAASPYEPIYETRTDAAGAFVLSRVPSWPARVVADHDPEGVVTSAELRRGAEGTLDLTLVLTAGVLRGVVSDGEGRPIEGATLSVAGVGPSSTLVRRATSDAAGAFALRAVPGEATALTGTAPGFKSAQVALLPSTAQERVATLRLFAAPPVPGEVLDVDGRPVGARVVACEGLPNEHTTSSGGDGAFSLPPSAIGCAVFAQLAGFAPSEPVPALEGRRLTLRLGAGGAIEGAVVDARGVGVSAFEVGVEVFTASRGRGARRGRQSFEDARGVFRLERLLPGSYVLTATAPGKTLARSDVIEVTSGATTRGVRVVLQQGGAIVGRVTDERGAGIAGAELRFDGASSVFESRAVAQSDAAGRFRLEGAPAGPNTVRADKEGFRTRFLSGLRVESGGTLTQEITLSRADGGAAIELGGIGATLRSGRDGVFIASVYPNNPAQRAGLRAGDRVTRVDGEGAEGMSVADVLQRLRGPAGTTVGVSVLREGAPIDVLIVRATIVF